MFVNLNSPGYFNLSQRRDTRNIIAAFMRRKISLEIFFFFQILHVGDGEQWVCFDSKSGRRKSTSCQ